MKRDSVASLAGNGKRSTRAKKAVPPSPPDAEEFARLLEQAEHRERELAALLEVSRTIASTLDLRGVLGAILDQLGAITEHTGASILLVRDDAFEFVEARSITGTRAQPGARILFDVSPVLAAAMKQGETVIIDDVRADEPMAAGYRAVIRSIGVPDRPPFNVIRSWMSVPLALEERVLGALTISWTAPAYFTADHARLARAFADQAVVAIENARLYEEVHRRAKETEALFRSDDQLFRSLDLDAVLQALVDVTVDVLAVDGSIVATWDADARVMSLRAWRDLGQSTLAYIRSVFDRRTQSMDSPAFIVTEDISRAPAHLVPIMESEGLRSLIEIPVVSPDGRPLGFFSVGYRTDHQVDEAEKRLFTALAERAAIAISNAELHERARHVASLEERQRLARELHDSVSQALYGIALGARTARTLLDRDPPAAVEPVEYVLSLAETGLAEMRALIFELRPESLETEGLNGAIRKQVDAARARHGIKVDFLPCDEPDLPLAVKEAVYRIAQEALTNVVKHSEATQVRVTLSSTGDELKLEVDDDGKGFDTAGDFPGHLGLKSMRERAQNSGGRLEISSRPGAGTRIAAIFAV